MKIVKVISGGQTGADIAGVRAAQMDKIPTGGWAPKGFLTEKGPEPTLLKSFNIAEHSSSRYPPRTLQNILDSDVTLIFASDLDGGSKLTAELCVRNNKPFLHITRKDMQDLFGLDRVVEWLHSQNISNIVINVAGNRESKSPGIEEEVVKFLMGLFWDLLTED